MGITVAVTRAAATIDVVPYTQDITTADLGGLTPKAAILICSYGITDGTAAANAGMSFGAVSGTSNRWCITINAEDGQGTTDTHRISNSDKIVFLATAGTATDIGSADINSFIANGIRLDWETAPGSAYLITAIFFAGTDLSAHADYKDDLSNTVDLTTDITAPGFEPDVVIAGSVGMPNAAPDSNATGGQYSLGFTYNDGEGGITQRSVHHRNRDGLATTAMQLYTSNSYGIVGATTSLDWGGEFGTFDSDGFSVTTRNNGGNNTVLFYLALAFGGAVSSWVGTHTTPTATGNDSDAGPGFTPQMVMQLLSLAETADTGYGNNLAGSCGVSAFDADDEYTTIETGEDNVATSNEQSLSDDRAIVVPDDDGTLDIEATFVSMDANGWTVNYSNAPATAKLFPALAIGAAAAVAPLSISVDATNPDMLIRGVRIIG